MTTPTIIATDHNQLNLRESRQLARDRFVKLAELTAIQKNIPLFVAAKEIARSHWEISALAVNPRSPTPWPTRWSFRAWCNPNAIRMARTWPDTIPPTMTLTSAFEWLEPYLALHHRTGRPRRRMQKLHIQNLLAAGVHIREAAQVVGVSVSTVYRWRKVGSLE